MFFIALIIFVFSFVYLYFKISYKYWDKIGLKSLKPRFLFGNLESPSSELAPAVQFSNMYNALKNQGLKHGGVYLFSEPVYLPVDPDYVKNILIKDFHHFVDRGMYYNEEDQPIIGNLFFVEGARWKKLRAKLTPTFTSGKMKMMFETMLDCAGPLKEKMGELAKSGEVFDVKDISARFTIDVIGSCAFGLDCNSFKDPNSEFRKFGSKVFEDTRAKTIEVVFKFCFPNFSRRLGLLVIDKSVEKFFTDIVKETCERRRSENIKRKDFLQLLIELRDSEEALTMNEVIAQAFAFFVAGFDTSATVITFCLFELAQSLDVQRKLRSEIRTALQNGDGQVTYDLVMEMKYLQQVIEETLRKYPPVSLLNRICTEDYEVPNSNIVLRKGVQVGISIMGLHRDPEFYPDPDKFDPERFSKENKRNIVPGTYMPFGDGPKVCIGLRFGMTQVKIGLITLIKDFEFSLNPKTQLPLQHGLGFILTARGGVWLNCKRISA